MPSGLAPHEMGTLLQSPHVQGLGRENQGLGASIRIGLDWGQKRSGPTNFGMTLIASYDVVMIITMATSEYEI